MIILGKILDFFMFACVHVRSLSFIHYFFHKLSLFFSILLSSNRYSLGDYVCFSIYFTKTTSEYETNKSSISKIKRS